MRINFYVYFANQGTYVIVEISVRMFAWLNEATDPYNNLQSYPNSTLAMIKNQEKEDSTLVMSVNLRGNREVVT